ncbi:TRAM domain-containing protein [Pseudolysinimonas sp.]|uniref:class I SAM-dependent RNA methyltransferase n=1 Tax=Pseudolysinimonas sp. TaxID=2680009 RepID=UPI00286C580B|nr:TRAM domain-containing protein [Pseudolysinimonas sp.]
MGEMQGREIEVEATNMAHGGESVARYEGRVVFVADAIPGERVVARVTADAKKSFWRAETVRVLEPSPHRRAHIWPEASVERDPADRPGGADYGHIDLAHQRALKAHVLVDALSRMAKVEREVVVEALPGAPDGTGWRTRERLHAAADGTLGPYAARSHRVIPVADLPLAVAAVREHAPLDERMPGVGDVTVLASSVGDGARLVIGAQKPTVITERVGTREFRVDDTGFWQVHVAAPVTLSAVVQDAIDPALFDPKAANLDLYGGVGLLAAAVGDRFGSGVRITSVESDARATEHAAENLADWLGAAVVTARVDAYLRGLSTASAGEAARLAAATVVLDPPRSGAGAAVLDPLAAAKPAQIVYVACDPVAFARDVALLAAHGYELTGLRALDLFPHTHHVEAVGTFRRA